MIYFSTCFIVEVIAVLSFIITSVAKLLVKLSFAIHGMRLKIRDFIEFKEVKYNFKLIVERSTPLNIVIAVIIAEDASLTSYISKDIVIDRFSYHLHHFLFAR